MASIKISMIDDSRKARNEKLYLLFPLAVTAGLYVKIIPIIDKINIAIANFLMQGIIAVTDAQIAKIDKPKRTSRLISEGFSFILCARGGT